MFRSKRGRRSILPTDPAQAISQSEAGEKDAEKRFEAMNKMIMEANQRVEDNYKDKDNTGEHIGLFMHKFITI